MKKTALLTLLSVAFGISAKASNISIIDFSGTTFNIITSSNGTPIATGAGRIRIGYFNTAAQSPTWSTDLRSEDPATVSNALAAFVPLGENTVVPHGTGSGTASGPRFATRTISGTTYTGRLAGQITGVTPVPGVPNTFNAGGVPAGTRIYLLVYSDGSDTVLNAGEELGVFGADTWLMPADGGLNLQLNSTNVDLPSEIARGDSAQGQLRLGALVPEPSSSLMALLAGMGLIARRRR